MSPNTNKGPLGSGTSNTIKAGAQCPAFPLIIYSSGVRTIYWLLSSKVIFGRLVKLSHLIFNFFKI